MAFSRNASYGLPLIIALTILTVILLALYVSGAVGSIAAFTLLSLNVAALATSVVIIQWRIEKASKIG